MSRAGPPMTVYEMLDYLRGEGIERIYKNRNGYWLHELDESGEITYETHHATGPYATLEEAIHIGAKR